VAPDHWPDATAFLSNRPLVEGHTLIVPKVHVQDFASDPDVSAAVVKRAAELMRWTPRPMVMLSLRGKEAGQEVMHFHLHLIPREAGDGLRIVSRSKGGRA
jgi:histidine triad (HIT) family protein